MMRDHLVALDERFAFRTSARFDLLAMDHVPYAALSARDPEGALARAIERGEGVIAVTGRMGSGKSSVIAAVTDGLDEGFVPLRVTVVGVEAGSPPAFARHAMVEIRDLPEADFDRHERLALTRATAVEQSRARSRELRAGFTIAGGQVLTAGVVADLKAAATEELKRTTDPAEVLSGLQRLYDAFWRVGRCPVIVIDDTDHWGGDAAVADAFFDQTARALGRLDAVVIVAAQSEYARLEGYQRIRQAFTAEIELPALSSPADGLATILQRRIDLESVLVAVGDLIEPDAWRLVVASYEESVSDGRAGDMRRTLAVVRNALELALEEPSADAISAGHVQEAMARNPIPPASSLPAG
jgi:Cdc6-like AAA superfamily ATPase